MNVWAYLNTACHLIRCKIQEKLCLLSILGTCIFKNRNLLNKLISDCVRNSHKIKCENINFIDYIEKVEVFVGRLLEF